MVRLEVELIAGHTFLDFSGESVLSYSEKMKNALDVFPTYDHNIFTFGFLQEWPLRISKLLENSFVS